MPTGMLVLISVGSRTGRYSKFLVPGAASIVPTRIVCLDMVSVHYSSTWFRLGVALGIFRAGPRHLSVSQDLERPLRGSVQTRLVRTRIRDRILTLPPC